MRRIWSVFGLPSDNGEKWYRAGLHFECHQCGGCCGGFPGYVWLSSEEMVAIAEYLKTTPESFQAEYVRKAGRRITLIEKPNYDCAFLERQGEKISCRIYPVRPRQCRTWPFWRPNLASPETWNDRARRCPGINRGRLHTAEEIDQARNGSPC